MVHGRTNWRCLVIVENDMMVQYTYEASHESLACLLFCSAACLRSCSWHVVVKKFFGGLGYANAFPSCFHGNFMPSDKGDLLVTVPTKGSLIIWKRKQSGQLKWIKGWATVAWGRSTTILLRQHEQPPCHINVSNDHFRCETWSAITLCFHFRSSHPKMLYISRKVPTALVAHEVVQPVTESKAFSVHEK